LQLSNGVRFFINANCGRCGRQVRPGDLELMPRGIRIDCPCGDNVLDLEDARLFRATPVNDSE
jgi:hypothetical protein